MPCKHLRNLGGNNQPFIWECRKGILDVKESKCNLKWCDHYKAYAPKPTYSISLTKKQIKDLLNMMTSCYYDIEVVGGKYKERINDIEDKLRQAIDTKQGGAE